MLIFIPSFLSKYDVSYTVLESTITCVNFVITFKSNVFPKYNVSGAKLASSFIVASVPVYTVIYHTISLNT